jgi:PadR family transcriptional regulator, regulatory protein AphA
MSIEYAILGYLSWKPLTGYQLKKNFEESTIMYWSGNNNQIYKALVQLQNEGCVSNEVIHQESLPYKKIYTITQKGLDDLRNWVMLNPEVSEFKKSFLVQLAWSNQLSNEEILKLIDSYENEVKMKLIIHNEKNRRGVSFPERNKREKFIWEMISENFISSCENELIWIEKIKKNILNGFNVKSE